MIFSADALINAWFIANLPWDQVNREKNNRGELMPESEAVTDGIRKLLQLRMSFVPYLYTAFNEYHAVGKPPIRAMVLDWPEDPKVRQMDDEFMFGDSRAGGTHMFAGESKRRIYLPAGDWHDFWTRTRNSAGEKQPSKPQTESTKFLCSSKAEPCCRWRSRFSSSSLIPVSILRLI